MSIRSEAMAATYRGGLSPQLQDLLRRNGMRAQVAMADGKFYLLVKGHDSPMIEYPISEKQLYALGDGGTSYSNKTAYKTFNNIVRNDFDIPASYVAARNVNGRVSMGLHGYRETVRGRGWYGGHPLSPGYLGMQYAAQDGFHLRRFGNTVMVPVPSDGRIRPGELVSGSYGYYYKGAQARHEQKAAAVAAQKDPLAALNEIFSEVKSTPRPKEPAKPYKEMVTSPVYFSSEKWGEVLSSHGIVVDEKENKMTILSKGTQQDFTYSLSEEDTKKLMSNDLKAVPLDARLGIINKYIGNDFNEKVTMDMLNSKQCIAITAKEVQVNASQASALTAPAIGEDIPTQRVGGPAPSVLSPTPTLNPEQGYVNGKDLQALNERKGWYREGRHGREVSVGDIWVEKTTAPAKKQDDASTKQQDASAEKEKGKGKENEVTYKMSAVINGNVVSHEISKKQYEKFMSVDDYQRQRMMSKIFDEVDMKTRPEMKERFNLGAFIAAGLRIASDITFMGADIAHNISHIKNPHPRPNVYHEVHGGPGIFYKPGVDTPEDIARRAYDVGMSAAMADRDMGRGR